MNDPALSPAIAAAPRTLVVLQPLRHGVSSYPAGRYTAVFSDGRGVYYESPTKVIQTSKVFGAGTVVGGFYFPSGSGQEIRSYVEASGQPVKVIGAVPELSYRFER